MQILVTLDENYLAPLEVMLLSLFTNNPGVRCEIWLMHRAIPPEKRAALQDFCAKEGAKLHAVQVEDALFAASPVTDRYPVEMYYRLLAPLLLPASLERVLYLDPDTLVINSLEELWELDLEGRAFAAASHTGLTELTNGINRVRLGTEHDYYNTGVLLFALDEARRIVDAELLFQHVEEHQDELLLPDQDVFNALYGGMTLEIDDARWNYDARNYAQYLLRSGGEQNLDWVMENTSVLHFCGRAKPWQPAFGNRFGILYKHYASLLRRRGGDGRREG